MPTTINSKVLTATFPSGSNLITWATELGSGIPDNIKNYVSNYYPDNFYLQRLSVRLVVRNSSSSDETMTVYLMVDNVTIKTQTFTVYRNTGSGANYDIIWTGDLPKDLTSKAYVSYTCSNPNRTATYKTGSISYQIKNLPWPTAGDPLIGRVDQGYFPRRCYLDPNSGTIYGESNTPWFVYSNVSNNVYGIKARSSATQGTPISIGNLSTAKSYIENMYVNFT